MHQSWTLLQLTRQIRNHNMNFFKRLKNIWTLSEFEPQLDEKLEIGTKVVQNIIKKPENPRTMATIIKLRPTNPVEEALSQVNEEKNG